MTTSTTAVIGGVDTHKHTHYAAAIDTNGVLLGHLSSPRPTADTSPCCPGSALTVSCR
jgi:hypothetical protein